MDLIHILDKSFNILLTIDDQYSMVWIERYAKIGEFSLELPIYFTNHPYLVSGNFIIIESSKRVCIIEDVNPVVNETDSKFVLKGLSSEKILKERVTDEVSVIQGLVQPFVEGLIDSHFINPTNNSREYPRMSLETNPDDRLTSEYYLWAQYEPSEIYDILKPLLDEYEIGFKMELVDHPTLRGVKFSLVAGVDRSYQQDVLPRVTFSEEFDNVISSSYYVSTNGEKTSMVVVTDEPKPLSKLVVEGTESQTTGWDRKEAVTVNNNVSWDDGAGGTLLDYEVYSMLYQRAYDEIREKRPITAFDGEVEINGTFVFEKDFFLGDLVQFVSNGFSTVARIVEVVRTIDTAGVTNYISLYFVAPPEGSSGS